MRRRTLALNARVASAQRRAEDARREAYLSRRRYEIIHEEVVEPLAHAGSNGFAATVRQSLPAATLPGEVHWEKAPCLDDALPDVLSLAGDDLWRLCLTCPVSESCVNWHCKTLDKIRSDKGADCND